MDSTKRRWGDRRDGRWLREEDSLHQITPYLMPNRADNEAFIKEQIDLTAINAYLAEKNAGDIDFKYTFFHIIVAALVKTVTLRPRMNRFIQGRRLYLRNELSAAFVVKKQFTDSAHEALAFIRFTEEDTVDSVHNKIRDEVRVNRKAGNVDNSTSAMDTLCKLPRPILRFIMWLASCPGPFCALSCGCSTGWTFWGRCPTTSSRPTPTTPHSFSPTWGPSASTPGITT